MWVLPILCWVFCVLLLVRNSVEWRVAFLAAAILWGCLVTTFTEFLSYFDLLTMGGLSLCWGITAATTLLLNLRLKEPWPVWHFPRLTTLEKVFAGGIALICFATFVTAILAPPNTWDSMTYHMSRVMHWLQNRSVAHYPTHILRQIELNPWAEFAITHFQALSGGDRYANLVQWFSMVGSLVGVSLIAERLGGDRRAQLLAVIVAATIPMGILQASSTQNDYVVAFWLVCLAWAGLQFMKSNDLKWIVVAGASLGLAVLTKGTAYLYAFPYVIWIAFAVFRGIPRKVALAVLCLVAPYLLLNMPHYYRNVKVFSNPLLSGQEHYSNEHLTAGVLVSNVLRNVALLVPSPSQDLNRLITDSVANLHKKLGLNVNDPRTTWQETEFKIYLSLDEDNTGNLIHTALTVAVLLTILIVSFGGFRKTKPLVILYVAAVTTGFFLFCLVLKWQPWQNRLLLPLFVLGAPVVGLISLEFWKSSVVTMVAFLLLTASWPWAFCNTTRPLIVRLSNLEMGIFPLFKFDRNQILFFRQPELYQQYVQIVDEIRRKKSTNIGLVSSGNGFEYPLWVLINKEIQNSVHIEHVEVKNASRLTRTNDFQPDLNVELP